MRQQMSATSRIGWSAGDCCLTQSQHLDLLAFYSSISILRNFGNALHHVSQEYTFVLICTVIICDIFAEYDALL